MAAQENEIEGDLGTLGKWVGGVLAMAPITLGGAICVMNRFHDGLLWVGVVASTCSATALILAAIVCIYGERLLIACGVTWSKRQIVVALLRLVFILGIYGAAGVVDGFSTRRENEQLIERMRRSRDLLRDVPRAHE